MSTNDHLSDSNTKSPPTSVREDQEYLEPLGSAKLVIGWQEEIHGPGGRSVDGYRPTVFELQQLARHWYRERWDIDLDWIYIQQTGSREIRIGPYADRRLCRINEAIGEQAFQKVIDEVDAAVRMQIGEEDWVALTGSDKAARQRLDDRVSAALEAPHPEDPSALCGADIEAIVKGVWPWITNDFNGVAHKNVWSVIHGGRIGVAPKEAARIRELAGARRRELDALNGKSDSAGKG